MELVDYHFSLIRALEDSLFCDIRFVCSDGRDIEAHRAVLAAGFPKMEEKDWQTVFRTQPYDMCHLLLSCIYSDRLPPSLKREEATKLVQWLGEHPSLERLTILVTSFIRANNIKKSMCQLHCRHFRLIVGVVFRANRDD